MLVLQALGTRAYETSREEQQSTAGARTIAGGGGGAVGAGLGEEELSADHQLLCQIGNCLQLDAVHKYDAYCVDVLFCVGRSQLKMPESVKCHDSFVEGVGVSIPWYIALNGPPALIWFEDCLISQAPIDFVREPMARFVISLPFRPSQIILPDLWEAAIELFDASRAGLTSDRKRTQKVQEKVSTRWRYRVLGSRAYFLNSNYS